MLRAVMAGWVPAVGPARVRACLDPGLTITDEAGCLPSSQGYVTQAALGVVIAILEPLQVGLDDALKWEKGVTTGARAPQPVSPRPRCLLEFLSSQRRFILLFDQSINIH